VAAAGEKVIVLPGKKYTPEDILNLAWRRKWLIAVPLVVAVVCTAAIAHRLPKKYRSETVILVVPQRVPESYVRSTVTTHIEDRLASLREQIESRSRLERVIQEFGLYTELQRKAVMEDVVAAMRLDIDVKVERGDSFKVSYISDVPKTAQQVTERLARLFIEENVRDRTVQAEGTNQFLDSQMEQARQRLLEHEKKLEDYQKRYSGQLPAQVAGNMQAIQSAQLQLQSIRESIDRDRDRRLVLERQAADLQATSEPIPAAPSGGEVPAGASTAQQLDTAQARLRALELRYTPEHPDVRAMKGIIRDLEAKLQTESAGRPGATSDLKPVSLAELTRQKRLRELNVEMQNLDTQLDRKRAQDRQLQDLIASYQAKVDAAPTREAELTELNRDYETLKNSYTSLLGKREDSKVSANLERNQSGEQFRVLDPARLPERPYSPDVLKINLAGAFLGLAIGLGLVGLLEYRDSTFKTEGEVERLLQLPVLALVPMMASELELRTRRRRGKMVVLAVGVVILSSAVAVAFWKIQTS
jgi:polysaccharide chain length determinant protein (PEP-CTERM system associated)